MIQPVIDLQHINVTFHDQKKTIHAVRDASLRVDPGDIYGIVGYSGAGKSTLVRVIDRLQEPSHGKVIINGHNILTYHHKQLLTLRKNIGVVFQHFNLMNSRTVLNNVEFPLLSSKLSHKDIRKKAHQLLKLVSLDQKSDAYPAQLSGGQKQRVAIARALANHPQVLISDEATSALDPKNTSSILHLLKRLNDKFHLTILLITHEMDAVKAICNKVAFMEKGQIIEKGSLFKVFSQPQQLQTREFINRNNSLASAIKQIKASKADLAQKHQLYILKFLGSDVKQPLIINLYRRFSVTASVLYGSVEFLEGIPVGRLIVSLQGKPERIQAAVSYCKNAKIHVRELD